MTSFDYDNDDFEWIEYPTCRYCGIEILSRDESDLWHKECRKDYLYIRNLYIAQGHTLTEWFILDDSPDAKFIWLESLLKENNEIQYS